MTILRGQHWLWELVVPLLAAALLTVWLVQNGTDLACSKVMAHLVKQSLWATGPSDFAQALYKFGPWPGISLAVIALAVALAGGGVPALKVWRRPAAFVALFMILGPGLIINGLLKPEWGRPRPRQLVEFGGSASYRAPWQPGPRFLGHRSFPSGHAAMGFFLSAPYFVFSRRHRWARVCLAIGIGAGTLIGLARILQGAHFLTDVLWSGMIVYTSGWILARFMLWQRDHQPATTANLLPRRLAPIGQDPLAAFWPAKG